MKHEPRSSDDENGKSSNRESATGVMAQGGTPPGGRPVDSTPVRIPPCARARRPDKEHVSMTEETVRYWNLKFRTNDMEQIFG
jgi:hypothetical protein